MSTYKIEFWYDAVEFFYGGQPDLKVETMSRDSEWAMDDAFKTLMTTCALSSVAGATFTVYKQDFPKGFVSHRQGLTLVDNVYSYTGF